MVSCTTSLGNKHKIHQGNSCTPHSLLYDAGRESLRTCTSWINAKVDKLPEGPLLLSFSCYVLALGLGMNDETYLYGGSPSKLRPLFALYRVQKKPLASLGRCVANA